LSVTTFGTIGFLNFRSRRRSTSASIFLTRAALGSDAAGAFESFFFDSLFPNASPPATSARITMRMTTSGVRWPPSFRG
jgi:hypothetical protein